MHNEIIKLKKKKKQTTEAIYIFTCGNNEKNLLFPFIFIHHSYYMGYFLTEQKLFKNFILLRFGVKIWCMQKKIKSTKGFP